MKVLVIGLDGANLDLIKRWAQDGKLPTFKKLMSEGSYGYLESVTPTLTVPAWNCLASGKNPGRIGCYGFVQKKYGSYEFRFPFSLIEKEKDVWDILSDYRKKVFVFNAPNVQYSYEINGFMVAGPLYLSEKRLTYPANLKEDLTKIGYEGDIPSLFALNSFSDNDLSRRLKEITEKHFKSLYFFLENSWDFGFAVFSELDRIQHRLWNNEKIILSHYKNIDRKMEDLLRKLEKEDERTNLIIVSDHGFGPAKRIFLINEWLAKKGYLALRKIPSIKLINFFSSFLRKLKLINIIRLITNFPLLKFLYVRIGQKAERTPVIWDKTKAFSYGTWGTIYLNLIGREPQGTVKKEEYEPLRTEIIDELKKISVKTYRREELYQGKYLESAPDIIIQTDDFVNSIHSRVGYGREFVEGFDGDHRKDNGTFIAWGPEIRKDLEIKAKMYDIAPTILYMYGIPIPNDMDGKVLKEIFEGEIASKQIKYQDSALNKSINRKIKELKSIGKI